MYILQLLDTYGATYANLVLIILLCLVVAWIYGKSLKCSEPLVKL